MTKTTISQNGAGTPPTRKSRQANRFQVRKDGNGWRVTDTTNGRLHSARIADKARAQRQADTMNERVAQPVGFLEATVITTDGQVRVEHDERNDARGRKQMDAWCWKRNESAKVLQIAVERTDRRAGYRG